MNFRNLPLSELRKLINKRVNQRPYLKQYSDDIFQECCVELLTDGAQKLTTVFERVVGKVRRYRDRYKIYNDKDNRKLFNLVDNISTTEYHQLMLATVNEDLEDWLEMAIVSNPNLYIFFNHYYPRTFQVPPSGRNEPKIPECQKIKLKRYNKKRKFEDIYDLYSHIEEEYPEVELTDIYSDGESFSIKSDCPICGDKRRSSCLSIKQTDTFPFRGYFQCWSPLREQHYEKWCITKPSVMKLLAVIQYHHRSC